MNIKTFDFKPVAYQVRTVVDNDTALFVAKDVCEALEITNVSQAVSRLDDDEHLLYTLHISGQNRDWNQSFKHHAACSIQALCCF